MLILSLDLEDVKSYDSAHIEFAEGVNAIVGHNGAGKSTILEAIGFALFDHLPYKQDDFVREGCKSATVTVTFSSSQDERPYQAVRRCGSSSQYYIFDPEMGAKICEGKADVASFLRTHMGVDPAADLAKLFNDAVGVPQGTLTAAFLQTPANRKPIFDPLLRVEEYKKAFDALNEPRRLLEAQAQELEVAISKLEARVERLPELQEQLAQLQEKIALDSDLLESVKEKLTHVQEQTQRLETLQKRILQLQHERDRAKEHVTSLTQQLDRARQVLAEAEQAQSLLERFRAGYDAYRAAQARKQEIDESLRQRQVYREQKAALERTLSIAETDKQHQEETLAEIERAQKLIQDLEPAIARQAKLEAELEQAKRQVVQLENARTMAESLRQEIDRKHERLQSLTAALERAEKLQGELENAQQHLNELQEQIRKLRDAMAGVEAEKKSLASQIETLQQVEAAVCPVCEQPLTPEHRDDLLERNGRRLANLDAESQRLQEEANRLEDQLQATTSQIQQLEQELRRLPRPEEKQRVEQEIADSQSRLQAALAEIEALATAAAQVTELEQALQELGNPRQQLEIARQTTSRLPQVKDKLAELQTQIASVTEELTTVEGHLAAFAGIDEEVAQINESLRRHEEAYVGFTQNQRLAETLAEKQATVQKLEDALTAAVELATQQEAKYAEESSQFDEAEFQALRQQQQELREQAGKLTGQLASDRQQLSSTEAEIQKVQNWQNELEAKLSEQAELQKQQELLVYLRGLLREAGPYVTKALVQQISLGAAQFFSEIMQDYTRQLRWQEDYGIALEVDGRERQFAQLSGGEQMSAALAVRLALLREMSDIEIAFFDEPTTNLDESRREALVQQILGIQGFRQLFVISHDDTFEQATDHIIRVERQNGLSVATAEG
jgi:exonuclease SbcC